MFSRKKKIRRSQERVTCEPACKSRRITIGIQQDYSRANPVETSSSDVFEDNSMSALQHCWCDVAHRERRLDYHRIGVNIDQYARPRLMYIPKNPSAARSQTVEDLWAEKTYANNMPSIQGSRRRSIHPVRPNTICLFPLPLLVLLVFRAGGN